MNVSRWSLAAALAPAVLLGAVLVSTHPSHALGNGNGNGNGGNPPGQQPDEVLVVNPAASPVPVTGALTISGTATVDGDVNAAQAGAWTVGIDPARNLVAVASAPRFDHDGAFSVVNDGETREFGPFDIGAVQSLRIIARAVNGDVRYTLIAPSATAGVAGMQFDEFTVAGESGNRYQSHTYDAPPSQVIVRVTEAGGPGGANFQFMLVGR